MTPYARFAQAIRDGRAKHPDWKHIKDHPFIDDVGEEIDVDDLMAGEAEVSNIVGACAWGFAIMDGWDRYDDAPHFYDRCPECGLETYEVTHLNDTHDWTLDQITAHYEAHDANG